MMIIEDDANDQLELINYHYAGPHGRAHAHDDGVYVSISVGRVSVRYQGEGCRLRLSNLPIYARNIST